MSDILDVESKMVMVRGQVAMLDCDVAALYGVETKHVNQAVKNNPGKFLDGYAFALYKEDADSLRSKILAFESEGDLWSKILTANISTNYADWA